MSTATLPVIDIADLEQAYTLGAIDVACRDWGFEILRTADTEYAPLPSTISARNPPRYRPINWGEFRARRAAGDCANQHEYTQISHYSR